MSQICPLEWRDGGNKILNSNCLSLPTEKAMETCSSVLAWRTPGTGELGGLPSVGSHRVGHD